MLARLAMCLVAAAIGAGHATAQRVAPVVQTALVEHRVDAGAGVEVSSGPVLGAGLQGHFGTRWRAHAAVAAGALSGSNDGVDRDLAELRVGLAYQAVPWGALEAGYFMRTFTATLGRQRWSGVFAAVNARVPFAVRNLAGVGTMTFLPAVRASELDHPGPSVAAAAGLEWTVARVRIALTYAVEGYEFPAQAGVIRSERLTAMAIRIAWRPRAPHAP